MVAASRLRRAQERIQQARPFAIEMLRVLNSLASRVDPAAHPLLDERSDAAGRRQGAALRDHRRPRPVRQLQHQRDQGGEHVHRREPGARGRARPGRPPRPRLLRAPRLRGPLRAGQPVRRRCSSTHAQAIAEAAIEAFTSRPGRQRLPGLQRVQVGHVAAGRRRAAAADSARSATSQPSAAAARRRRTIDYLYEPTPEELFTQLLPRHVEVQVFRALLESNAAFYAAQMTAMDAATRNAADMIEAADAVHEQGPPGGDHARDHRSGVGRRRAVAPRARHDPSDGSTGRQRHGNSSSRQKVGKVVQVIGPVVDVEFAGGHLPAIYNAVRIVSEPGDARRRDRRHRGGRAAPRREPRAHGRDEADRRHAPRHEGRSTPARRSRCRSAPATLGRVMNVLGEPVDFPDRPINVEGALVDPPRGAVARGSVDRAADVRDRHQGRRPARAVPARRQDRAVRRRRRRQDGHHPGADPQRRDEARRRVGVRRRRRAHARGQRPLARVPGERRHQHAGPGEVARRAGLRPDDRAAGRAPARRAERPDGRRVLPRRREEGRAPLHRQHLPLHAGGLGSVGAARPHAERGRLPADAADRDGRAAGADHLDQERARSPRSRRSTCPPTTTPTRRRRRRSRTSTRRRTCRARSSSWASTRRSIRWRRPRASSTRASSATSTTTSPAR